MKAFLTIFLCCLLGSTLAQNIQIDRIDIRGNKIIVRYILNDVNPNHKYSINLYSSMDKFAAPLTKVSGDVGSDVRPGEDKKITWSITNELGDFKGSVSLEIRGSIVAAFMQLSESGIKNSFNRGKSYPITWTSGNPSGELNIELYKANQLIWRVNNIPNTGNYNWTVPGKTKPGKDYLLKFVNAKDPDDFLSSATFAIKPRTPLALKVGAIAVLGAGVSFLGGGSKGGNTPVSTKLPDPPSAPGH